MRSSSLSLLFVLGASALAVACATTTHVPAGPGSDTSATEGTDDADGTDDTDGTSATDDGSDDADGTTSSSSGGSSSGGSSSGGSSSGGSSSGGSSSGGSSSGGSSSGGSSSGGSSSGGSSSGGSSGTLPDSCSSVAASCTKGGPMTYCVSYGPGNVCSTITYAHDGKSASCPCTGGDACTDAYYVAYTDCQDAENACADLDSCCDSIDPVYESTCRSYVSTYQGQNYGDVSCKSILTSWESSGLCP